jgi:hypothetical protein
MTRTENDMTPIVQALSLGFIAGVLFTIIISVWMH